MSDSQLRAAHLILGYTPISKSFLVLKCVIKAKDPCLHRISIAALGFLLPDPKPKGIQVTTPIFEVIPKVGASSFRPVIKEEKKEKEEKGEKIVDLSDSEDNFDVFDQALSLDTSVFNLGHSFTSVPDEMGIQQKPKSNLLDLIES